MQAEVIDQRLAEKVRRDRLSNAGLTGKLAGWTFEAFERRQDWPEAIKCQLTCQRYADLFIRQELGNHPWLILYGNYGCGKSHLAAAIVHEVIEAGAKRCYFRVWPNYLERLMNSFGRSGDGTQKETTGEIVSELESGNLIVIDDIDKQHPTRSGWAEEKLYTGLNRRHNRNLATVLTFNFGPGDADPDAPGRLVLEKYLGRAILDRIAESQFAMVPFGGPSYRSKVMLPAVTQ